MDIYDREVERLTELHKEWEKEGRTGNSPIYTAWCNWDSSLFDHTGEDEECSYGCLTQVHSGREAAPTAKLTKEIRADSRIPDEGEDIRPEHLPVFAEWRRKLDQVKPVGD